jgi:hypothetical protein
MHLRRKVLETLFGRGGVAADVVHGAGGPDFHMENASYSDTSRSTTDHSGPPSGIHESGARA